MNSGRFKVNKIKDFPKDYSNILLDLFNQINQKIQGKREVMYSDIINIIMREGYYGEVYNDLIVWCNLNIKNGIYIFKPSIEP